jgi:enterochelin esterase-like enzyme
VGARRGGAPRVEQDGGRSGLVTKRPGTFLFIRSLVLAIVIASCGPAAFTGPATTPFTAETPTPTISANATAGPSPTLRAVGKGRLEKNSFHSNALNRTLQYWVYVPGGYDADTGARFPVAYLLHGSGGDINEWPSYGLIDAADKLMGGGVIPRFIIVLPEGDQEYWVDHVVDSGTGANGEKWGTYSAREVVPTVDTKYRTIARASARAIGGLSMGGHGAMQLSMNFPGIWSAIGAHSPSLRSEGVRLQPKASDAPTFLGFGAEFAARDPLSLIKAKPDVAKQYTWWIDAGSQDPWKAQDQAIHDALTGLGIKDQFHVFEGGHELAYWAAHMEEYLRYYAGALCPNITSCP